LTTLQQLIATYPAGQVPQQLLVWEGATLNDLGRHQQAIESLLAANCSGPPNLEARFQQARAYAAVGNLAAATTAAEQALAIDATHAGSRQLLQQLAARDQAPDAIRR
jgi:tetratricopeptide (TPR) repeat protein